MININDDIAKIRTIKLPRLWNSLNEVKQSTLQPGTNIEDVTL